MRLLLLLLMILSSALVAQNDKTKTAKWTEYEYPDRGFAISGPFAPDIHPDMQASDVTVYRWQWSPILGAAVHAGLRPGCREFIASFKDRARGPGSKELASTKEIEIDGNPGLESTGSNETGRQYRERVYCVGENAYALTGEWPIGKPEPPVLTRWLSSFRLVTKNSH